MKAEADRFFLEGVNQLIGHGWPYTPPGVAEPGWSFYAAAVFDDHNPWWMVMPDVTKYLQRVSCLLRQSKPANDVAVLLPNDDAYASFSPGEVSLSAEMPKYVTPELMRQILSAGHNVDYIDAEAIERVGIPYSVLVLPHAERLSPKTMKAIEAYAAHGGKVIAVGSTPQRAPGFVHADEVSREVQRMSRELFAKNRQAQVVASDAELGAAISHAVPPDLQVSTDAADVGFIHRKLPDADIYFVANTGNHAVNATATFGTQRKYASSWDPFSGASHAMEAKPMQLHLAPYESRVMVFSDTQLAANSAAQAQAAAVLSDITRDWQVSFPASAGRAALTRRVDQPGSWADDPQTLFFSGVATYTKTVHLNAGQLAGAKSVVLDFGEGTPVTVDPKIKSGMRALLEGPVREAAVVMVNGKRAGSVWHPPYRLEVGALLHAGENRIEVRVANTAINLLAGQALPDYRLLNARYGVRFVPQDTENLQPLPSGILGPVRLLEAR